MKILVVAHALARGGAQESLLELLGLLKTRGVEISVLTSEAAEHSFLLDLRKLEFEICVAPHKTVAGYPDIAIEKFPELVKSSDLMYLGDEVYLAAPRAKRIDSNISVVAHLHCAAILCPVWHKTFGLREPCNTKCSLTRIIKCKQSANEILGNSGVRNKTRMKAYEIADFVTGPIDFIRWPMEGNVLDDINGYVACSHYLKNFFLSQLPELNALPFEVIYSPNNVPKMSTERIDQNGRPRILYASGSYFLKGPHIALQAAKQLLDEGDDFLLSMSRVKGQVWIEKLVSRLGLQKNVELLPRLDRSELYRRLAGSDLVLMPSIWPEPFGRIPVEANRLGTPAIVSDEGGLPETTINGITGFIAEASVEAFANAMSKAMAMEWNRERIIDATSRRFDSDTIADNFVRFLERFV